MHGSPTRWDYGNTSDSGVVFKGHATKSGDEAYIKKQTLAEKYVFRRMTAWYCGWHRVSAVGNLTS